MKQLIAIDGNSLLHRAFYALPSMTARDGTPTGAVYGFLRMLLKLTEGTPDYMLVAFDMHGPTFRHKQYEAYKAGRRETPEDLRTQFPLLKELLRDMGICVCECESYEADDILGTIARIANEEGVEALLVTGDRDALQLVGEHTRVMLTKKGITETAEYDVARLMEEYGLSPMRMVDLKALMGDGSDNIPGIPGVGEKTALRLLSKYGSMENTLLHAAEEKGALREKLTKEENAALARLSYDLGKIERSAPISVGLADCAFVKGSLGGAAARLRALGMHSLVKSLPAAEEVQGEMAPLEEVACETVRVDTAAALAAATEALALSMTLALWMQEGRLSLSNSPGIAYTLVLGGTLLEPGLEAGEVFAALRCLFEDAHCEKILFDAKTFRHALEPYGIRLEGKVFDLMIADYLLHATHPAESLGALAPEGGAEKLFTLRMSMEKELEEKGLKKLFEDVETPLCEVLGAMEKEGFAVDAAHLRALGKDFKEKIAAAEEQIYALAGGPFNILSPKQLGSVLFDADKLALPVQKKTKSGYSTDAEVMERLQSLHPIIGYIMEYRQLTKLKSTFVDVLLAKGEREGGRVHTSFNQNVTATGRISSTEPNLQNIPVRTETGREIRRAFIASPGCLLVDADYSQIELRLLAHMSGDPAMIDAFRSGEDIHTRTASEVFGVPIEMVSKEERSAAKAVNFGIVYGISDFGLAKNLDIDRKTARAYIDMYFARYPGVQAYLRRCVEEAREKGYVSTLLGRRRELPELRASNHNTRAFGERVAMNMPIQGTAADIIKLAMVRVYRALREEGLRARLILQVHDELIVDAPEAEAARVAQILKAQMEGALALSVPLLAEVSMGASWYEAK